MRKILTAITGSMRVLLLLLPVVFVTIPACKPANLEGESDVLVRGPYQQRPVFPASNKALQDLLYTFGTPRVNGSRDGVYRLREEDLTSRVYGSFAVLFNSRTKTAYLTTNIPDAMARHEIRGDRAPYFQPDGRMPRHLQIDHFDYADRTRFFSRGHLTPSGDFSSWRARRETFVTTNIAPQVTMFNQGLWNRLERCVVHWQDAQHSLQVFTGVLWDQQRWDDVRTLGRRRIWIPSHFYKILFRVDATGNKISDVMAFMMRNRQYSTQEENGPLSRYLISIAAIEKGSGLSFFSRVDEKEASVLKEKLNSDLWSPCPH